MVQSRRERAKQTQGNPLYDEGGEMSFAEIAKEIGTTRAGAWVIYHRAIRKLRENGELADFVTLASIRSRTR